MPLSSNLLQRATLQGTLEGYPGTDNQIWIWKAIPFAKPPIGALRWRAPEDPVPWHGVRQAKAESPPCMQLAMAPSLMLLPEIIGQEDCLYLDIYRPSSMQENLPVYVWIHGGANFTGSAAEYNMEALAVKANMVVVVLQYRLSVFGYFTHPALRVDASPAEASGNFGTLDQIKALQWVQKNIGAFGGNPDLVTIAGESAGGHNVMGLLLSPLAEGLFHRGIMQSGGMLSHSVASADQVAENTITQALAAHPHSDALENNLNPLAAWLRQLPAANLLQAHAGGPGEAEVPLGNLIEDGHVIPGNLLHQIERGDYHKVPLIVGANADEVGSINILASSLYEGMPDYLALAEVAEGRKTLDQVLPSAEDKALWTTARHLGSRLWRSAMVDELARRVRLHQQDIYAYSFNWGREAVCPGPLGFIFGAAHALEIPFFHGNVDSPRKTYPDFLLFNGLSEQNRKGSQALSDAIVAYLKQFVRTGNPNAPDSTLPRWEPWSNKPGAPKAINFDADLTQHKIDMGSEEIPLKNVQEAFRAEDLATRRHMLALTVIYPPYRLFEAD